MYDTQFLDIPPLSSAAGRVHLPGSKSISNRVLLLAALSAGVTRLDEVLASDDTRVMLQALAQLGVKVRSLGDNAYEIHGLNGQLPQAPSVEGTPIFLGNAGTAMRPLVAALALLPCVGDVPEGAHFLLHGVPRMHERPIGDLVDALRQLGARIEYAGREGFPPLRIDARASTQELQPLQNISVRGDVSSQFLTALLLSLPLLAGDKEQVVEVQGELISKPYIHITLELLARFGVHVHRDGWQRFTIERGSRYRSPEWLAVEADASSASYFIALGAIAADAQNPLEIQGVGLDSIQGDIRFIDAARQMGAVVEGKAHSLSVHRGRWPLQAIDLDCNHIPDAAMTLAVMALYAQGTSTLRNIASWRVKETDRIAAMAAELRKLGASVVEGVDFIQITPPARPEDWRAASIATYDDHRMAMCFSLAAFNPAVRPVRICDPRCVGKTFPDYFEAFFSLVRPVDDVPIICVDGPTASGKGTVAAAVARALGFHLLDSGALYRIAAVAAMDAGIVQDALSAQTPDRSIEPFSVGCANEADAIAALAAQASIRFDEAGRVWLGDQDVSERIRSEAVGMQASRIAAMPAVRTALLDVQRRFARLPGLVADGRDMGTTIFPRAALKVFLSASVEQRAQRRHLQLTQRGIAANIDQICADLQARDARDMQRSASPLRPAPDALPLDTSECTAAEAAQQVLNWWDNRQPFAR